MFQHLCDLIIKKKKESAGKERESSWPLPAPSGCSSFVSDCTSFAPPCLWCYSLLLCCIGWVYSTNNGLWWIKSGDYKNIQTDHIGFQESLNQSKLEIAEKEAFGLFVERRKIYTGMAVMVEEGEHKPWLFWVMRAGNATASITEWLRTIWLWVLPFSRREEEIMDKQWLCQVQIANVHIYSVTQGQQQLYYCLSFVQYVFHRSMSPITSFLHGAHSASWLPKLNVDFFKSTVIHRFVFGSMSKMLAYFFWMADQLTCVVHCYSKLWFNTVLSWKQSFKPT